MTPTTMRFAKGDDVPEWIERFDPPESKGSCRFATDVVVTRAPDAEYPVRVRAKRARARTLIKIEVSPAWADKPFTIHGGPTFLHSPLLARTAEAS